MVSLKHGTYFLNHSSTETHSAFIF